MLPPNYHPANFLTTFACVALRLAAIPSLFRRRFCSVEWFNFFDMDAKFTTISHEAQASNPGQIRLSRLRWVRFYPFWPLLIVLGFTASALLAWKSSPSYFWPAAFFLLWHILYWRRIREHFHYGDCNPGVVLQTNPLQIATATDMRTGQSPYPVLKVVQYKFRFYGRNAPKVGDLVPTVSLYWGRGNKPHWDDFFPIPAQCATGDKEAIEESLRSFPWSAMQLLETLVNKTDSEEPGLYWFQPGSFRPIPKPQGY